jgi:hypothetical protein
MRSFFFSALALALIGCSANNPSNPAQVGQTLPQTGIPEFEDLKLESPIESKGIVLIPVSTSKPSQEYDDYVTLAEAKEQGWIEVIEVPGQETVDTLKVRYTGPKPMILFAGELLLGGKQDRVVAKDTIVKPDETKDVMVFCVEPGRWSGESMHFEPQVAQVPLDVKEEAQFGDQNKVWAKVDSYNSAASRRMNAEIGGSSLKGGYGAVTSSKEYKTALADVMKSLEGRKDVVGLVIVLDGKVHSFEYFASPRLFNSSYESVVRGALASGIAGGGRASTPAMADVADFVSRSLKGAKEQKLSAGQTNGLLDLSATSGVTGATSNSPDSGGVIHGSFYEKKK